MHSLLARIGVIFSATFCLVGFSQAEEVYKTDPDHTFVNISYNHRNYSVQTIRFDRVSGLITLNDASSGGTINMSIDTKSINTGSVIFNQRIQQEDLFATEQFPVATFKSEAILFGNNGISAVQGDVTIKGITKPLVIQVTHFSCGPNLLTLQYTCGANATAKLNRSDFNMGKYVPLIGDEMTLQIAIEASRE
jgi:polyisoprenoid-binding protein YceI